MGIGSPNTVDQCVGKELRVLFVAANGDIKRRFDRRPPRALNVVPRSNVVPTFVQWENALEGMNDVAPAVICLPAPPSEEIKKVCRDLLARRGDTLVIGYSEKSADRNLLLREQIADIAVTVSELNRSSLALLREHAARLRELRAANEPRKPDRAGGVFERSKMIGCMIASKTGIVQWANICIARWLGYPHASHFVGIDFPQRHLKKASDWIALAAASDDEKAYAHATVSALDVDSRWATFRIEVTEEPGSSGLLRLFLLDESPLQLYKATAEYALDKVRGEQKAAVRGPVLGGLK